MRILVCFGSNDCDAPAGSAIAYLVEEGATMQPDGYAVGFTVPAGRLGHGTGCRCCTPRGPAAEALTRMFHARSTGEAPFFQRVIVLASAAGEAMVREALAQDIVTKARYIRAG